MRFKTNPLCPLPNFIAHKPARIITQLVIKITNLKGRVEALLRQARVQRQTRRVYLKVLLTKNSSPKRACLVTKARLKTEIRPRKKKKSVGDF